MAGPGRSVDRIIDSEAAHPSSIQALGPVNPSRWRLSIRRPHRQFDFATSRHPSVTAHGGGLVHLASRRRRIIRSESLQGRRSASGFDIERAICYAVEHGPRR